jgi:hypothetical protein
MFSSNLQDYSWQELKLISDSISVKGEKSKYYPHMLELMRQGSTKTFSTTNDIIGKQARVRIIGLCQDQKSEDNGMAGITFQFTHALPNARCVNQKSASKSWEESEIREWLAIIAFDNLPKDLKDNISSVKKYYKSCDTTSTVGNIGVVEDRLFLLSAKEIFGRFGYDYQGYELEGTGENHNQQYAWYEHNNTTKTNCPTVSNTYLTITGEKPIGVSNIIANANWWLRSACDADNNFFCSVNFSKYGCCSGAHDACLPFGIVPAFAF